MIFDPNYLLYVFLPTLLLSFGAQMLVRNAYAKWSKVRNGSGLTGTQVAQQILSRTSLGSVPYTVAGALGSARTTGISLARTGGQLTDHYDPRTHTVHMSEAVANQPSVVAMAVVAHELGHAQQHEQNSVFIQMRNFLLPAVRISPMISYGMIFLGLFLRLYDLIWLGVLFFAVVVAFTLLTLPVEIDASRRGLALLTDAGLLVTSDDEAGSRRVLTAAAMTYVAAAVTAVLQLLYYISLAQRRR
jgi:Zn-dependent membrane protease YugP